MPQTWDRSEVVRQRQYQAEHRAGLVVNNVRLYRIIDPAGCTMPLRPITQGEADRICSVLNLLLDPER